MLRTRLTEDDCNYSLRSLCRLQRNASTQSASVCKSDLTPRKAALLLIIVGTFAQGDFIDTKTLFIKNWQELKMSSKSLAKSGESFLKIKQAFERNPRKAPLYPTSNATLTQSY